MGLEWPAYLLRRVRQALGGPGLMEPHAKWMTKPHVVQATASTGIM
jgi:hypothetical protein